jgi:outer membrane protein assembly factor BamB
MKCTSRFTALFAALLTPSLLGATVLISTTQVRADWPTYLHDNERTATSSEQLALPLHLRWVHESRHPPRPAWPPSAKRNHWGNKTLSQRVTFDRCHHVVATDGHVYFGTSADDKVVCLDLATGQQRWQFFAEGPVRLAPSLSGGRVYFGSDDGFAYCLQAENGELLWKVRVAPEERRIAGNQRIVSAWPVRSGVMVFKNHVRCASGLFPRHGAWQFALDAASGKELAKGKINISPQGYMQQRDGRMYLDSGRSGMLFLTRLKKQDVSPIEIRSQDDKTSPTPSSIIASADLRFIGSDGEVKALDTKSSEQRWSHQVDGRVHSLAICDGSLLVSTDQGKIYCFTSDKLAATPAHISHNTELPSDSDTAAHKLIRTTAKQILAQTDIQQGYCLVLGSGSGRLAYELARQSKLRIVGIESDKRLVDQSRHMLDRAGVYGTRVTIHHGDLGKLPYADYLFNLVVSERLLTDDRLPGTSVEVRRVLRPGGGIACLVRSPQSLADNKKIIPAWLGDEQGWQVQENQHGRWATLRREPLSGTGEWTHLYADPANSTCSGDTHVGNQLQLQWFGPPGPQKMVDRHFRTMSPLYKDGRLIVPGNDHLFAVDAYNGRPLWERAMPGFRRIGIGRDAGNMALSDDLLYVVTGEKCLSLDVASGAQRAALSVPAAADTKPRQWGYLAVVGEQLFGSAAKPGASRSELTRKAIHEVYQDSFPLVTSDYLFSLDRRTGLPRWRYDNNSGAIINPSIAIGDGHMFFVESGNPATLQEPTGRSTLKSLTGQGAFLVALDLGTGKLAWRQSIDLTMFDHDVYLSVDGGRLILSGSGNVGEGKEARLIRYLLTFDTAKGTPGWKHVRPTQFGVNAFHGEQNVRPVIVGDRVYFQPVAYELATGQPIADWKMIGKRKGCGMMTASNSAFYFRHQQCHVLDLKSLRQSEVTHVTRPGCWINILPVGGMLLIPEASSGCSCAHSVQCSLGFVPKRDDE